MQQSGSSLKLYWLYLWTGIGAYLIWSGIGTAEGLYSGHILYFVMPSPGRATWEIFGGALMVLSGIAAFFRPSKALPYLIILSLSPFIVELISDLYWYQNMEHWTLLGFLFGFLHPYLLFLIFPFLFIRQFRNQGKLGYEGTLLQFILKHQYLILGGILILSAMNVILFDKFQLVQRIGEWAHLNG